MVSNNYLTERRISKLPLSLLGLMKSPYLVEYQKLANYNKQTRRSLTY